MGEWSMNIRVLHFKRTLVSSLRYSHNNPVLMFSTVIYFQTKKRTTEYDRLSSNQLTRSADVNIAMETCFVMHRVENTKAETSKRS